MTESNFNIQRGREFVSYVQMVNDHRCVGIARFDPEDKEFNEEYGKALAYARFDYEARKNGISSTRRVIARLEYDRSKYFDDDEAASSEISRLIGSANEHLAKLLGYQRNQKKIIKCIEDMGANYAKAMGCSCGDILQIAHDAIVGKKKEAETKEEGK